MSDDGALKSTLTKIIAGNFPPTQGQIAFAVLRALAVLFSGNAAQFLK